MEMETLLPKSQQNLFQAWMESPKKFKTLFLLGDSGSGKDTLCKKIARELSQTLLTLTSDQNVEEWLKVFWDEKVTLIQIKEIEKTDLKKQALLEKIYRSKSVSHPEDPKVTRLIQKTILLTSLSDFDAIAKRDDFSPFLQQTWRTDTIHLLPLRKRVDELPWIAETLVQEIAVEIHQELYGIDPLALDALKDYDWPGNLRELRNVLKIAALHSPDPVITLRALPDFKKQREEYRLNRKRFESVYFRELLGIAQWKWDKACEISGLDEELLREKLKILGINSEDLS